MMPSGGRVALSLLVLLVATGALPAQAVVPATGHPVASLDRPDAQSVSGPTFQRAPPDGSANNSTVQHEDPDAASEDGDLADLRGWYESELGSRLANSTIQISQGEYERARSVLGDGYDSQLSKYVDVAGETPGESDDRTAEDFRAAKESQQEFASTVEEYRTTREQYLEARREGDEDRARELARELERLEDGVNRTGANLTRRYERLGNGTDVDLSVAQQAINETTENVSSQQASVRRETFVRTTLAVQPNATTASFLRPLEVSGTLTAANGTKLADRRIVVELGSRHIEGRTNGTGAFAVTVRPTLAPSGPQSVTVRYVPRNASAYLGTTANASVNVTQVEPTVDVSRSPQAVGFEDVVAVTGRIHARNVSATGVPVRVSVGGVVLGTTETAGDGSFTLETPLPASVPSGEQQLRVALVLSDRALAGTATTRPVTVETTRTQLSLNETNRTAEYVQVGGVLRTESGAPVPNQTVTVRVGSRTVTTATTNASGYYLASVPKSALSTRTARSTATVTVVFGGAGNLKWTRATTAIGVSSATAGEGTTFAKWLPVPPWVLVAGVAGLGAVALLATRSFDRFGRQTRAGDDSTADSRGDVEGASTPSRSASKGSTSHALLDRARTEASDGDPDVAVRTAYAAVREGLADALDLDASHVETRTHWEFYRVCRERDGLADNHLATVEELTEAFERARFRTGITSDAAVETVEAASGLLATLDRDSG